MPDELSLAFQKGEKEGRRIEERGQSEGDKSTASQYV